MSLRDADPEATVNPEDWKPERVTTWPAIELRDWFAGHAMKAFAKSMWNDDAMPLFAEKCYRMADAMMAERSKR